MIFQNIFHKQRGILKLFGKELKLFFADKFSEHWAYEIDFFQWMGSMSNFVLFENSIQLRLKGDHRGFFWSLHLIGCKLIEFNVYDTRHDEAFRLTQRHGLDT